MSRILVVDDDVHIARTLRIMLEGDGHTVRTVGSGEEALALLASEPVDVALVDLQLPGLSGTDVLRVVRQEHPAVLTIIITAHGSVETAVQSMKEGAFDFLTKPFSPAQVRHRLSLAERHSALEAEVSGLRRRVGELPFRHHFRTRDQGTLKMLEVARRVATSDTTVLIAGETGTGKTLLAHLMHDMSARHGKPFVTVDCASFRETLLESELFGHKRGAFTGAVADEPGRVDAADGGTLFLDEIGEIPLHLQGKLLRFVEERAFERVGESRSRTIDARILAATNRDLAEMVQAGDFREDLFFRLSIIDLEIPALRRRPDDVLLLGREFLSSFARREGKPVVQWDGDVERALLAHAWPGNVRELAHALERAVLLADGPELHPHHLPARLLAGRTSTASEDAPILPLAEVEELAIRRALMLDLPLEVTARRLGIDPSTLWRKRKRYDI